MSFEQDLLHGYEKYTKTFEKWCEKSSSMLGNVTQCGILECDDSGHAFIAANNPGIGESYLFNNGYKFDSHLSFNKNPKHTPEHKKKNQKAL